MFRFIELLNTTAKSLKNLALYVTKAFELRNETLNDIMDKNFSTNYFSV